MTICKPKLEANLVNWEGMLGEVAKTNVSRIFKSKNCFSNNGFCRMHYLWDLTCSCSFLALVKGLK